MIEPNYDNVYFLIDETLYPDSIIEINLDIHQNTENNNVEKVMENNFTRAEAERVQLENGI